MHLPGSTIASISLTTPLPGTHTKHQMEFFVNDMKNLPEVMKRKLSDLRDVDSLSSSTLKSSAAEEAQLLDELAALAKADPDFDEGPITEKFNRIVARRQEALNLVDDQMKKIQKLYDLVDNRITFIGKRHWGMCLSLPYSLIFHGPLRRFLYEGHCPPVPSRLSGGNIHTKRDSLFSLKLHDTQ